MFTSYIFPSVEFQHKNVYFKHLTHIIYVTRPRNLCLILKYLLTNVIFIVCIFVSFKISASFNCTYRQHSNRYTVFIVYYYAIESERTMIAHCIATFTVSAFRHKFISDKTYTQVYYRRVVEDSSMHTRRKSRPSLFDSDSLRVRVHYILNTHTIHVYTQIYYTAKRGKRSGLILLPDGVAPTHKSVIPPFRRLISFSWLGHHSRIIKYSSVPRQRLYDTIVMTTDNSKLTLKT